MVVTEMAVSEIDEILRNQGIGVLSLTDGAETYAVPESFGYDGETLYFQFVHTEDSQKMAFMNTTEIATFTASVQKPPQSVIVRGPLEKIPEAEEIVATNTIAENGAIPTLNVIPDRSLEDLTMEFYRLNPRERSGRKFGTAVE